MRTELKMHLVTVKNSSGQCYDYWCEDFKIEEAHDLPAIRLFNVWSSVKTNGTDLTYGEMSDKEILMYPTTLYGDFYFVQESRPDNNADMALWLWRTKEEVLASVKIEEPIVNPPPSPPIKKSIFNWFKG